MDGSSAEPVYLEAGKKRVFACALMWPGWARVAKDDDAAVAALAGYAPRYAVVAAEAGVAFSRSEPAFEVVERVAGSATTDFGAPDTVPAADAAPLGEGEADRLADLVGASWRVLDRVVADAPESLRKGPRGGGRDRDEIVEHVAEAERSYARKVGVRFTPTQFRAPGGQQALRGALLDVLRGAPDSGPVVEGGWPVRYAARRIAWHVLDHAWEIEDRQEP